MAHLFDVAVPLVDARDAALGVVEHGINNLASHAELLHPGRRRSSKVMEAEVERDAFELPELRGRIVPVRDASFAEHGEHHGAERMVRVGVGEDLERERRQGQGMEATGLRRRRPDGAGAVALLAAHLPHLPLSLCGDEREADELAVGPADHAATVPDGADLRVAVDAIPALFPRWLPENGRRVNLNQLALYSPPEE